jgi:tetratricopeptide (TPR) repeat protein
MHEESSPEFMAGLVSGKEYGRARKLYLEALSQDSNNVFALIGLAEVERKMGDAASARKHLDEALKLAPDDFRLHYQFGKLNLEEGRNEDAISNFNRTIELKKDHVKSYVGLASSHRRMKNYGKSLDTALSGLSLGDDPNLYFQLGETHYLMDEYEKAISSLEKALSLNPDDHRAWSELSYMHSKKQDLVSAIKCMNRAYEILPYSRYRKKLFFDLKELERKNELPLDASDLFRQAEIFYSEKKTDEALKYLDKCIESDGGFLEAYLLRGFIRYSMHDYVRAIEDNLKAQSIDPRCQQAYYLAGKSYWRLKNESKALKNLNTASELIPEDDRVYNTLALLHLSTDYEMALKKIERAINLYPRGPEYYVNRGIIFEKLNRIKEARQDYEMALKINPKYSFAQKKIASLGKHQEEKKSLDEVSIEKKKPDELSIEGYR